MPAEVLLVDESDGGVRPIRQALRVAKLAIDLNVATEPAVNGWLGARGYGFEESCYLRKPGKWEGFAGLLKNTGDFCLTGIQFRQRKQRDESRDRTAIPKRIH